MFDLQKNDKIIFNSPNSVDLDNYVKNVIDVRNHWNNRKDLINLHKDVTFSKLLDKINNDIKYLISCFSKNVYDKKCGRLISEYETTNNPFKYLSYVDDFCIPYKRNFSVIRYNLLLDYLKNYFRRHVNRISSIIDINLNNLKDNYINSLQHNIDIIEKNNYYNKIGIMGEIAAAIMLGLNFNHCFKIRNEIGTLKNQDNGDLDYNGCFIDIKTTDSPYNTLIVDESKKTTNNNKIDVYFLIYFNKKNNSYTFLGAIPHYTIFENGIKKDVKGVEKVYATQDKLMNFKEAYIKAMNLKLNKQLKDPTIQLKHNKIAERLNYINNDKIEWTKNKDYSNPANVNDLNNIISKSLSKLYNTNVITNFRRYQKQQINSFNDPNKHIKGFYVYSDKKTYSKNLIRNIFENKYPGYIKFYNKKLK